MTGKPTHTTSKEEWCWPDIMHALTFRCWKPFCFVFSFGYPLYGVTNEEQYKKHIQNSDWDKTHLIINCWEAKDHSTLFSGVIQCYKQRSTSVIIPLTTEIVNNSCDSQVALKPPPCYQESTPMWQRWRKKWDTKEDKCKSMNHTL